MRDFLKSVAERFPWEVAPYVWCMFGMVKVITKVGFTGRFAEWMISASGGAGKGGKGTALRAGLVYAGVSALMVNLLCDLPSTVFWADAVRRLCEAHLPKVYRTVIYSLLVGNNPGCYLTTVGALAGLMWMSILKSTPGADQVRCPRPVDLGKYGFVIIVPVLFCCVLAVWIEVELFA